VDKKINAPCESKLALPAPALRLDENKIVKIIAGNRKSPAAPGKRHSKSKNAPAVTDELFLDTIRNDVYNKLVAGEFELSLGDGFKAIDLKNKLASPEQSNRLAELLEELRKELLR